jgi:hypothetical protein
MAMDAPSQGLTKHLGTPQSNSNNKMQEKNELSKEKKTIDTPSLPNLFSFFWGFTLSKLKTYECINSSPIISDI